MFIASSVSQAVLSLLYSRVARGLLLWQRCSKTGGGAGCDCDHVVRTQRESRESKMRRFFQYVRKSKALKFGLPFVSLLVIGSFGLSEFTAINVERRTQKNRSLTADEALEFQKKVKKVDVEKEFKELNKKLDIEHWENKRGPRPWENNETNDSSS